MVDRSAVTLAVLRGRDLGGHVVVARERGGERFSMRSSTHLTGRPVTIEATIAQM
jgi:hypothetical protein